MQEYHRHFMDSLAYDNAIPPVPPQFHPLEVILLWISQHIFRTKACSEKVSFQLIQVP
jgi:hypothetical protein